MFTIYFAHHWDFSKEYCCTGCAGAFRNITEARQVWAEHGIKQEIIDEYAQQLKLIKIGETSNAGARNYQLKNTSGIKMRQKFRFEGTYADSLFIESYVRSKIEKHFPFNCSHDGNDHFWATNTNVIRYIDKHFLEWCEEGLKILEGM